MTMPELKESRRVMKEHGKSAPMRKLLLAAILSTGMLAAASEPAFPASITFNTALPVTEGEGILRIQSKYFDFGDDSSPLDRDLSVWAVRAGGCGEHDLTSTSRSRCRKSFPASRDSNRWVTRAIWYPRSSTAR
ncbi:MAG: hypothetical protein IH936_13265 [Acidobacteria bacterium]|nr:hypothetical protein [Acidobacteriota bacterium]